ncbi:MAG: iron-sulfur cluster assembly accessory protein [Polyangiaceae bacterium]
MEMQSVVSTATNPPLETAPKAPEPEAAVHVDAAEKPEAAEAPKRTLRVSDQAVEAIRRQVTKRGTPDAAIRVGVRGGGCSGFSYVIEFDDKPPRKGDIVLEFAEEGKQTVRVFCDKKSILYLQGSVLDWEKTLMYTGYKFKNPQEASRCGCGHSFTVS